MCKFLIQKKALTFYSQSLICHCNALVLLRFIILPYKTSALRLRFWVTYQAGESEPMLDVLTFQGNKDYQVFFRIGKDQSDCIFTTNESEALAGEVRSLMESRANDK